MSSWFRSGVAIAGVEDREDKYDNGVVPSCPVTVGKLKIVRDLSLRGIVRCFKGRTGVIVAPRVGKRQILKGIWTVA